MLIEAIEAEGWKLDDVGYVFRQTGNFAAIHGGNQTTAGEVFGIYLFRRVQMSPR